MTPEQAEARRRDAREFIARNAGATFKEVFALYSQPGMKLTGGPGRFFGVPCIFPAGDRPINETVLLDGEVENAPAMDGGYERYDWSVSAVQPKRAP